MTVSELGWSLPDHVRRTLFAETSVASHDHPHLPSMSREQFMALFRSFELAERAIENGSSQVHALGTARELEGATHIVPLFAPTLQLIAAQPDGDLVRWDGSELYPLHTFHFPVTTLAIVRDDRDHQRLIAIADGGAEAIALNLTEAEAPLTLIQAGAVSAQQTVWPKRIAPLRNGFALDGETASARFSWKKGMPELTTHLLRSQPHHFDVRGTPFVASDEQVWSFASPTAPPVAMPGTPQRLTRTGATTHDDARLTLWDPADGEEVRHFELPDCAAFLELEDMVVGVSSHTDGVMIHRPDQESLPIPLEYRAAEIQSLLHPVHGPSLLVGNGRGAFHLITFSR